MNHIAMLI